MGKLSTSILQDGNKNTTIQICGLVDSDDSPGILEVLVFGNLMGAPKGMKLEAMIFAIQEKMGLHLWWTMHDGSRRYVITLESRGRFDFEALQGLQSPEGVKGLAVSIFGFEKTKGQMGLMILLDMDKKA